MVGKLLQVVGVVAIVGLVGGAIGGFAVLKDRVRVVVQSDEAEMGPDPTALLRDDVTVLSSRLESLQQAVAANFERLATGLEDGAEQRHDDVRALRREVADLTGRLGAITDRLAAVDANVQDLQDRSVAAAAAAAAAAEHAAETPAAASEAAPPVETPAETPVAEAEATEAPPEPATEPTPTPPEQPAAKPKRGSFLSFTLDAEKTRLDEPRRYELLPRLCRVGFDAKSTLHDFTGVTSNVDGAFRADFDDPDGLCEGEVVAEARTLVTGVDGRDENMYEHLDAKNHPTIRFAVTRFRAAEGGVDVDKGTASGEVVGKMTIRGKTRDLTMPVTVSVDPQQRLVVEGQTKLKLSDYEVPVPSQLGVINMEDEVAVWIALRARSREDDK